MAGLLPGQPRALSADRGSDSLIYVKDLSATEAARRFSEMLDAVEHRGESFVISRRGRPVARLEPATAANGASIRRLLRKLPSDPSWEADLRELRALLTLDEARWPA